MAKKSVKKGKKPTPSCVSTSVEFLTKFLKETTGNTYPIKTLQRRLNLLEPEERAECALRWKVIEEMALKIEWTIATRAENSFDVWP